MSKNELTAGDIIFGGLFVGLTAVAAMTTAPVAATLAGLGAISSGIALSAGQVVKAEEEQKTNENKTSKSIGIDWDWADTKPVENKTSKSIGIDWANTKYVENKTRSCCNPNTYVIKETHKNVVTNTTLNEAMNNMIKKETSAFEKRNVKFKEKQLKISAVEYECDLIILNYMLRQLKNTKMLEEILNKINFVFPYIDTYKEVENEVKEYDNFVFQEKIEDGEMNSIFKDSMFRRIFILQKVNDDKRINLNKQQFDYLNKILEDLIFNINFY